MLMINRNTQIVSAINVVSVQRAISSLERDIRKTCKETKDNGTMICLKEVPHKKENFTIMAVGHQLEVQAADELGFIYGIYEVSKRILGITEFWFWNDQELSICEGYPISEDYQYCREPFRVELRGWFVNDEVLLHTWSVNGRKDEPWEMVFEALLRCGGNMVIPGTDRNGKYYRKIASDMGLFITHHHAEPLGAEMFARKYPELNPSYQEHAKKFEQLWEDAIIEQQGMKVVWNIGFRGQGDCPFWVNDPMYQTNEARGELMSHLIGLQYDLLKGTYPEAICCTNLYGEVMELYQGGYLKLPKDVIKIWADNGFGKMVTRRQENHNPRIPALPNKGDAGKNGIYYHVSFYDLQAANHMTMLPNKPEFVKQELQEALERGTKDYWIVNCSNVKPHVYYLDLIATMWKTGNVEIEKHRIEYAKKYYGEENVVDVAVCIKEYFNHSLAYGEQEDEHAGEQFTNHVARILISQYMRSKQDKAEELLWATDEQTLEGQVEWYKELCKKASESYQQYLKICEAAETRISERAKVLYQDSLLLQAHIYEHCFKGAYLVCESLQKALIGDYQKAFYYAGKAKKEYLNADVTMRSREHGKWHKFYENECLTDVKQTAWVLSGMMSYLRNLGDGPHFYQWQREFLYAEEDRRVMLILNMENHLPDEELFLLMESRMGD